MPFCRECRYCTADTRVTDYRREGYYFCPVRGPLFSRNHRPGEGARVDPNAPACEHFLPAGVRVAAVVVAAGGSTRMGGEKSKLLLPLRNAPVLAHTLRALDRCPAVTSVVLVAREREREVFAALLAREVHKPFCMAQGGATRQASVQNGIEAAGEADYYAIHDGARPLATPEEIAAVCEDARRYGAATLAVPSKDTCKLADEDGFVTATVPRSALWAVQTPQVFEAELYREALRRSARDGCDFTDDCQLIEHAGGRVHLCRGSYENIKITTPEDLTAAAALLARREEET